MDFSIILPGFGKKILSMKDIALQPWNYLLQIGEDLLRQSYKVSIIFYKTYPTTSLIRILKKKGFYIMIENSLPPHSLQKSSILIPMAFSFASKIITYLYRKKLNTDIIGILTTPIHDLGTLIPNYVIIKLSGTSIVANSIIAENILFRLIKIRMFKSITKLVSPSRDYIFKVNNKNKDIKTIFYLPKVNYLDIRSSQNNILINRKKDNRFVLSYFGPYTEERGVLTLLDAFRKLMKAGISARLELYIRDFPSDRSVFEKLNMFKNKLDKNLYISIGYINKFSLYTRLLNSDIIVLPYRIIPSTIPLAFLEALLLEKPLVLSTGISGIREHVLQYLKPPITPVFNSDSLYYILKQFLQNELLYKHTINRQYTYVSKLKQIMNKQELSL